MRCSKPCDSCARDPAHDVCAALRLVGGEQGRVLGMPTVLSRGGGYTNRGERVLAAASGKHSRVAKGHWGHHVCQEVFVSRWWGQYIVHVNSICGGSIFIHEHIGYTQTCIGIVTVVVVTVTAVFTSAIIAVTVVIIAKVGGSFRRDDANGNTRRIASRRHILSTMHRGNGRQDTVCHRPSQLP